MAGPASLPVYSGDHLQDMQVKTGEMTCSAAPVLPDFVLKVEEILKKARTSNGLSYYFRCRELLRIYH